LKKSFTIRPGPYKRLEQALSHQHEAIKMISIRFAWVPMIDITAIRSLEKLIAKWQAQGIHVKLKGVNQLLQKRLQKSGLWARVGEDNIEPNG